MGEQSTMTSILDIEVGDNVRTNVENLKGLIESIKRSGIVQPLAVQEGTNGKVLLIDGHRRLEAAIQAGMTQVPTYEINEYEVGDTERIEIQIAANVFREDLTPLEKAQAMLALKDTGVTQREVAAAAGVTQKSATAWLKLGASDAVLGTDRITEDALLELALGVPTEDIAPTIAEFLEPTLRDHGYRDLEFAYERIVASRKQEAGMAKINAAVAKLEAKGLTVIIGERGQYGSDAFRGWKITDSGAKNADVIAEQDFGHNIVVDVKAHREEDCHVYYLAPGGYEDLPQLGEYCTKPKRHEKVNADVQVPNAKKIETAQTKRKEERKAERDERAQIHEQAADWLRDAKLKSADLLDVFQLAAAKTLPHGWQGDIAKLLELELDGEGDKQIPIPDSEYNGYRMESEAQRALNAYTEGKSEAWMRSFTARMLVVFDIIGNRRYGFDSTQLAEWYDEYTK